MQKLMQVILGQWANYLSVTDSVNFVCRIDADFDRSGHGHLKFYFQQSSSKKYPKQIYMALAGS